MHFTRSNRNGPFLRLFIPFIMRGNKWGHRREIRFGSRNAARGLTRPVKTGTSLRLTKIKQSTRLYDYCKSSFWSPLVQSKAAYELFISTARKITRPLVIQLAREKNMSRFRMIQWRETDETYFVLRTRSRAKKNVITLSHNLTRVFVFLSFFLLSAYTTPRP